MRFAGLIGAFALAFLALPVATRGDARDFKIVNFNSPTGNILCAGVISDGSSGEKPYVSCLVMKTSWHPPPKRPKSCEGDFVPGEVWLGTARAARNVRAGACRSDVGPYCFRGSTERCTVLAYGHSVDVGAIRCHSASSGITCRYRHGLRVGFRVASGGYALWYA